MCRERRDLAVYENAIYRKLGAGFGDLLQIAHGKFAVNAHRLDVCVEIIATLLKCQFISPCEIGHELAFPLEITISQAAVKLL